ncbi:MAG: alpha/beta fold hydrolase [Candidatus Acidiferrales bacterium]
MAQEASSRTVDVLTSIWQLVLKQPGIGADDNFFELGGNPRLAAKLSCEIESKLGCHVPPVAMYHTPTIASLAACLETSEVAKIPALTKLRAGGRDTPLFIAHGVGGSVFEFFELAKLIDSNRPVYGLQAKGSDGVSEPLNRFEDMADFHFEAIRKVQPHGPYFLAGHSLGGLVVLEIARRVQEGGENPGVLVMIDAYPHLRHLSPNQQLRLLARMAARRVLGAKEQLPNPDRKHDQKLTEELQLSANTKAAMRRVRESGYAALEKYRPRFYNGKINFVRAAVASVFPDDPAAIWGGLAMEFQLETAPGDHFEMLTKYPEHLATVLSRCAREFDA